MVGYIFLAVIFLSSVLIIIFSWKKNAWDVLFFNSPIAVVALFMIGILANDSEVWQVIVWSIAIIATGGSFVWSLINKLKQNPKENPNQNDST
jgi:hypothetical protein